MAAWGLCPRAPWLPGLTLISDGFQGHPGIRARFASTPPAPPKSYLHVTNAGDSLTSQSLRFEMCLGRKGKKQNKMGTRWGLRTGLGNMPVREGSSNQTQVVPKVEIGLKSSFRRRTERVSEM